MAKRKENFKDYYGVPFASTPVYVPDDICEPTFYGMILDEEQKSFARAIWSKDKDIVFCDAPAGTGKTTIATGVANMLCKYGMYSQIIYIMSPCAEKKQGYLPGSISEKSSVYFDGFYQACTTCGINTYTDVCTDSSLSSKTCSGYITCITDTHIRGVNFEDAVIIVDESQNFSTAQLKKTLTRVKDTTKVIVIGHRKQCDLEHPEESGFAKYIEHYSGRERAEICKLTTNHRGWVSQWADELEE